MKKSAIIVLTAVTFMLGACATTRSPTSSHAEMTKAEKYRALVKAEANKKSVDLTWVNPPDEDDLEKYHDL